MRDLGNTVIVVEHDEETMRLADVLVDLGPGAGELGGEVEVEDNDASCECNASGGLISGTCS